MEQQIVGQITTHTYAYMYNGAKCMLTLAEQDTKGQLYTIVGALIFCAFALEAYLNHLGKLRNKEWDEVEKKYSKFDKYKLFAKANQIDFDGFRTRPYVTLKELFEFRDRMAHGKTTEDTINTRGDLIDGHLPSLQADANWKSFATIEKARIAVTDVEKIINELHQANGYPEHPLSRFGLGVFGISDIPNNINR